MTLSRRARGRWYGDEAGGRHWILYGAWLWYQCKAGEVSRKIPSVPSNKLVCLNESMCADRLPAEIGLTRSEHKERRHSRDPVIANAGGETASPEPPRGPNDRRYNFGSAELLRQHFEDHGINEFGFTSEEEYLEAANRHINNGYVWRAADITRPGDTVFTILPPTNMLSCRTAGLYVATICRIRVLTGGLNTRALCLDESPGGLSV
jgi:hypothetical protein